MSITIITDNSFIGSGVQVSVPADSYVYVAESATVANTDTGNGNADGAIATGDGNVTIEVDGTVIASGYTIKLGSDGNDSGNTVIIGETGMVRSVTDFALTMYSDAMSIENSGTIRGVGGIAQLGYNTGPSTISNSGRIIATYAAISINSNNGGDVTITNTGLIKGTSALQDNSAADLDVINSGILKGLVTFGSGSNLYDGRHGTADSLISMNGGNDTFKGGTGTERIQGGQGRDLLTGGAGADQFIYVAIGDSTNVRTGRDLIGDFSHNSHDIIKVSAIDALATTGANDAFTFIGTSVFSSDGAEIRTAIIGASTFVYFNTDHDGATEMTIELAGKIHLVQSDFAL